MNEDVVNKELVFHMNESGLCVCLESGGVRSFPAQTTRRGSFSQHWEKSQEERRLNCLTLVMYKSDNDTTSGVIFRLLSLRCNTTQAEY